MIDLVSDYAGRVRRREFRIRLKALLQSRSGLYVVGVAADENPVVPHVLQDRADLVQHVHPRRCDRIAPGLEQHTIHYCDGEAIADLLNGDPVLFNLFQPCGEPLGFGSLNSDKTPLVCYCLLNCRMPGLFDFGQGLLMGSAGHTATEPKSKKHHDSDKERTCRRNAGAAPDRLIYIISPSIVPLPSI